MVTAYASDAEFLSAITDEEYMKTEDYRSIIKVSLGGEIDFEFSYLDVPALPLQYIHR